jgi:hypothetical protein
MKQDIYEFFKVVHMVMITCLLGGVIFWNVMFIVIGFVLLISGYLTILILHVFDKIRRKEGDDCNEKRHI